MTEKQLETIQLHEYDGTIEGYNLLIDRCKLDTDRFQISNINPYEYFTLTNKFTGHIYIHQFKGATHPLCGLHLRPGDCYQERTDLQIHENIRKKINI
jgi:hypothetical protein